MDPYRYFPVILLALLVAKIIASKYIRCIPPYLISCIRNSTARSTMLSDNRNFYQDKLLDSYNKNILVLNHGKNKGIPVLDPRIISVNSHTYYTISSSYSDNPHYCHVVSETVLKDLFPKKCFDIIILYQYNKSEVEKLISTCRELLKDEGYLYLETNNLVQTKNLGFFEIDQSVKLTFECLPKQVNYLEYINDSPVNAISTLLNNVTGGIRLRKFMKTSIPIQASLDSFCVISKEVIPAPSNNLSKMAKDSVSVAEPSPDTKKEVSNDKSKKEDIPVREKQVKDSSSQKGATSSNKGTPSSRVTSNKTTSPKVSVLPSTSEPILNNQTVVNPETVALINSMLQGNGASPLVTPEIVSTVLQRSPPGTVALINSMLQGDSGSVLRQATSSTVESVSEDSEQY